MLDCPSQRSRSEGEQNNTVVDEGQHWIGGPSSALKDGGTHQSLPGYSWEEADAAGHGVINHRRKILEWPEQESPNGSM